MSQNFDIGPSSFFMSKNGKLFGIFYRLNFYIFSMLDLFFICNVSLDTTCSQSILKHKPSTIQTLEDYIGSNKRE